MISYCNCKGLRYVLYFIVLYLSCNDSKVNSLFICWYVKFDMVIVRKERWNILFISLFGNKFGYFIICVWNSKLGVLIYV